MDILKSTQPHFYFPCFTCPPCLQNKHPPVALPSINQQKHKLTVWHSFVVKSLYSIIHYLSKCKSIFNAWSMHGSKVLSQIISGHSFHLLLLIYSRTHMLLCQLCVFLGVISVLKLISMAFEGSLLLVSMWFLVLMINSSLLKVFRMCCVMFSDTLKCTWPHVELQFCGKEPNMFLKVLFFFF